MVNYKVNLQKVIYKSNKKHVSKIHEKSNITVRKENITEFYFFNLNTLSDGGTIFLIIRLRDTDFDTTDFDMAG